MMKFTGGIFVLCAFFLIGVLSPLGLGGPREVKAASETNQLTVDQILGHVENKYTNSKFAADFIQKSTIKAMNITDMATGKVYIKYPGMMRWEYEKPDRQIIITDGDKLWVYRPEDNQVMTGKAPT
ncbi:MAG: outer membrane lipoprotein carrier protein LolA, partial [Desulfobacterales bacterium]|nr:outer membrane lipoprotein carrier protein LolA [Desulfobacterales bacterium]